MWKCDRVSNYATPREHFDRKQTLKLALLNLVALAWSLLVKTNGDEENKHKKSRAEGETLWDVTSQEKHSKKAGDTLSMSCHAMFHSGWDYVNVMSQCSFMSLPANGWPLCLSKSSRNSGTERMSETAVFFMLADMNTSSNFKFIIAVIKISVDCLSDSVFSTPVRPSTFEGDELKRLMSLFCQA